MVLNDYGDLKVEFYVCSYTGDYRNNSLIGVVNLDATKFVTFGQNLSTFYGGASTPPPDGRTIPLQELKVAENSKGLIITLSCIGYALSIASVWFLIQFRTHKVVRSTSFWQTLWVTVGCLLGYVYVGLYSAGLSFRIYLLRQGVLAIGYGITLSNLICKNALLATIASKKVQIKDPRKIVWGYRGINAVAVLIEAVMFCILSCRHFIDHTKQILVVIYTSNAKPTVQTYTTESNYFLRVNLPASTAASVMTGFNILIFLTIIPTTFMSARLKTSELNESGSLFFVAIVLIASYWLVQTLPSPSDPYSELKVTICIFVATTLILCFTVFLKINEILFPKVVNAVRSKIRRSSAATRLEFHGDKNRGSVTEYRASVTDGKIPGSNRGSFFGKVRGSFTGEYRPSDDLGKVPVTRKTKHNWKKLKLTQARYIYKFGQDRFGFLVPWYQGVCELNKSESRIWITFLGVGTAHSIAVVGSGVEMIDEGVFLIIRNANPFAQIRLEFESNDIARSFREELKDEIEAMSQ
ncbi:hypothetical protein BDR26DRAFT_891145 [Obelidium mucronatum]|nr:hypothetical protein BDR26DRAFT_891145 [Obelidium mucronatum]